jgi:hypothetical protein
MQQKHRAWTLVLFLVLVAAYLAAGQPASTPVTVQLLASPVQLVADFYDDDPTASCSTFNVVAVTVDGLLAAQQPASPVTVVASTSFSVAQLIEAEVFSAAGLTVSLLQQSGEAGFSEGRKATPCCCYSTLQFACHAGQVAVYSATGWARYRADSVIQALALSISGQQYRLCINTACPFPSRVSVQSGDQQVIHSCHALLVPCVRAEFHLMVHVS